ncbi:hypothetical protein [Sphingomonas sp. Mn802worker]|uniref:hypothetical protein n=1 Tax=Sphingomonas sp. Mn802worker TaxID=629773 RepID=UPI000375A7E7|nr:hypothetical protein [Sphingomonas sp. Mn802worker]
MIDANTGRAPDGRFLPGFGGRKPGSKNKKGRATLEAVQNLSSEAVAQLRDKVRAGEWTAVRYVLDYTLPKGGRTVELDSNDPNAIIDAAAMSEISPEEAARLSQAFKTAADASDVKELKRQVEELEGIIGAVTKR